jgi:septum formation protein
MERLGIGFGIQAPLVNEDEWTKHHLSPREHCEQLAVSKVTSVAQSAPGAVVIGCDQLVALDGHVFGKPGTAERAAEQLETMSGRTHELITALAVCVNHQIHRHTDVARLHMRDLSAAEIHRYLETDRPFDCAGSYKLESRGIVLFERIDAADHSAITGLPLIALATILRELGFAIP